MHLVHTTPTTPPEPEKAELNVRVLRSPALYLQDHFGEREASTIFDRVGIDRDRIEDTTYWISMRSFRRFLDELYALIGADDEVFRTACTYRIREAYGPTGFILAATTPTLVLNIAARTMAVVSRVTRAEVVHDTRNHVHMRYFSTVPEEESRLVCMSRQEQTAMLPTLFGLPRATISQTKCVAKGDDCCEDEFHFYTKSRWYPMVLGAALGCVLALIVAGNVVTSVALWFALPLLCALIGALWEVRGTYRSNLAYGERVQKALRDLAQHEADARLEVMALHQRQKDWTRAMEEQVAERTEMLQSVVRRIRSAGEERVTSLRGFSHDLRNPLSVMRANIDFLRSQVPDDPDCNEALNDSKHAIGSMERLLMELVNAVRGDETLVRVTPTVVEVASLSDRMRRRMKALVFGRNIRVSVFQTREAPETIETDELILERVIDNLCTNAAKYTERGSIVIELDGSPGTVGTPHTPGRLTLKVSDTGRGIPDETIPCIFQPRGASSSENTPQSLGLGLSVVVRLMAQIGGRIEVMSKVGRGTTFWAHFPVALPREDAAPQTLPSRSHVDNVVTIRRASA